MGRKLQISLVLAVMVLLAAAVGAYAWDNSRSDEIADGVEIGTVDVGGLTTDEAKHLVTSELVEPLQKPLVVKYRGVKYKLSPRKLAIAADVERTVDRALEVSREGGLPGRLWRYATAAEVNESIDPRVSYDEEAVDKFVARVGEKVNREAVNASVEPGPASIEPVPSRNGRTLQADELREQLTAAIHSPNARRVKAEVERTEPEVTTDELAEQYPVYLTVNRSAFELTLWEDLKLSKTYTVAIGAIGFDTPAGLYHIQNKAVDPAWSVPDSDWAGDLAGTVVPGGAPNNPLKERWLGIYDGAGIHGTDAVSSLGTAASHGCVRMAIPDVIELYDDVPVGTPIYIGG